MFDDISIGGNLLPIDQTNERNGIYLSSRTDRSSFVSLCDLTEKKKKKMSRKKEHSELIDRMEGERENVDERKTITHGYYSSRPKTFETMLGGYTQVHDPDIQESNQLIQSLIKVGFLLEKEKSFEIFDLAIEIRFIALS